MIQFTELNRDARASLEAEGRFPGAWDTMAQLEHVADTALARLRARRAELAAEEPRGVRALSVLDRLLWTERLEYLDRDDVSDARKQRIVHALHRMNLGLLSYHRFLHHLRPAIEHVARRERRPARVLELASGSGEFTMALGRLAGRKGLPVRVTGSDIVPAYVADANIRAQARRLPVRFVELNAFDLLSTLTPGDYDIYFIAQSIHHFSAGQLAMMVAQAGLAGARHFVGIDGRRSLLMAVGLPMFTALSLQPDLVHDAAITARRFYSEPELALIADIAAPDADVSVERAEPGYSVLHVRY